MSTSDSLLELIVKLGLEADRTSENNGEFSIILQCGGMLMSGKIISERDFILANPVTDLVDRLPPQLMHQGAESPVPLIESFERKTEYIHLRDVKFLLSESNCWPKASTYWRTRIDRVDGFTIGSFVAEERNHGAQPGATAQRGQPSV
jgi:hypothetical protein